MARNGFMVTYRDGGEYLSVTARMVGIADDGSPRNLPVNDQYRIDPFAGITASAQADRTNGDSPSYSYAWRLGIAGDLGDIVVIPQTIATLRTLARIVRGMDRLASQTGEPLSFGQYLARVASTAGVPILTGGSGSDGFYSSGAWVEWSAGDAARIIDDRIAAFRAKETVR